MYAIHLPRSSLFCEQPSVGTKRGAERCDGNGPGHYEAGFGKGMVCVCTNTLKWEWRAMSMPSVAPFFLMHSLLGMQTGELQLSRNACGKARPLRIRLAYQRPDRQDTEASPGRVFRPATFTPRWTKPLPSPVPLLPPSLKKIGRAAPVGLGYREKKRYRSPLVSL